MIFVIIILYIFFEIIYTCRGHWSCTFVVLVTGLSRKFFFWFMSLCISGWEALVGVIRVAVGVTARDGGCGWQRRCQLLLGGRLRSLRPPLPRPARCCLPSVRHHVQLKSMIWIPAIPHRAAVWIQTTSCADFAAGFIFYSTILFFYLINCTYVYILYVEFILKNFRDVYFFWMLWVRNVSVAVLANLEIYFRIYNNRWFDLIFFNLIFCVYLSMYFWCMCVLSERRLFVNSIQFCLVFFNIISSIPYLCDP